MPKYFSQSLPYRRLQKFANGIWDEERKTFYPFILGITTVPAKRGISYYVKTISATGANAGDSAVGILGWSLTLNGKVFYFDICIVAQTVAASNVNACNYGSLELDVLTDSNTALTIYGQSTTRYYGVVYAEIPTDPAGGPVVVE